MSFCKPHGMMNDDGTCPYCEIYELEARELGFIQSLRELEAENAKLGAQQPIDHRPLIGRIDTLEAENKALRELVRTLHFMAQRCPVSALPDDFDFYTPLEEAEALLEKEK